MYSEMLDRRAPPRPRQQPKPGCPLAQQGGQLHWPWPAPRLDRNRAEANQAFDGRRDGEGFSARGLGQPAAGERHGVPALSATAPVGGHDIQHLALDVGQASRGGRLMVLLG